MRFGVDFKTAKANFVDRKAVLSYVEKKQKRALSKFGAFVRATARQSIRKRKKASRPGQPPTNQTGLLKKFIFYFYDEREGSVVVGPVKLKRNPDALEALEFGGRFDRSIGRGSGRKRRRVLYKARPFMQPAYEKEKPQLDRVWSEAAK